MSIPHVVYIHVLILCTVNRDNFEQQGNFEHQLQTNKNIPNFAVIVDILFR